jgi:nitrous oxidase accessory protein
MKRFLIALLVSHSFALGKTCTDAASLVAAVNEGAEGARIELAAGTFALREPLVLKVGMQLLGKGMGKTIITAVPEWKGNPQSLPDSETDFRKFDKSAYLIHLADKAAGISISQLTLTGPQMHGAIYGWENAEFTLSFVEISDFQYSGLRTYITSKSKIHDCVFRDAGQRWENGAPGVKGGITGGGIFAIWISDTEISHNRFLRTKTAPNEHYYGIKGREGRRLKIHHNTIETNFSIEFPFEGDEDVEISHNVLHGTVSIPKHAGGPVPKSGRTFHIHHNLFLDSYSIEFVRNGVEIDHNLFDFDPQKDHGNLISGFGQAAAAGPALFHNNLVNNPGRGVIWINEPYSHLTVRNNHIIVRPTVNQRNEGLFGFHESCDFSTFRFENNIIECLDTTRPLFRNDASGKAIVKGNRWQGINDEQRYQNGTANPRAGLEEPLKFTCGVHEETKVDDWKYSNKK